MASSAVALARLVDQPCALESGGDVPADEGQELLVCLGVPEVLPVALHDEGAERLPLGLEGHAEPAHRLLADQDDLAPRGQSPPVGGRQEHRPSGP